MIRMIMNLALLASLFIIVSCVKSPYDQHEKEMPGIECPARLTTDANQLWICAHFIEGITTERAADLVQVSFDCILMDCYTVNSKDAVCQIAEPGHERLLIVAHAEAKSLVR